MNPILLFCLLTICLPCRAQKHKLPAGFEEQAKKALTHFPELEETEIRFRFKKAKLPYASRPTLFSLLNPFGNKKYVITISTKSTELRRPTLLKNLSFDAQIGALGHELAHVARYEKQRKLEVLADGIRYFSTGFKSRYEKETDEIAIQHGLGEQLLIWCREVYPVKLKDGSRWQVYHSPEELERLIFRHRS